MKPGLLQTPNASSVPDSVEQRQGAEHRKDEAEQRAASLREAVRSNYAQRLLLPQQQHQDESSFSQKDESSFRQKDESQPEGTPFPQTAVIDNPNAYTDTPNAYTDTRTHNGHGIYMTAGVHCCACWQLGEEDSVVKQKLVVASDIVQASGMKQTDTYRAAESFLADQLRVR
jgi:hypothetical protein